MRSSAREVVESERDVQELIYDARAMTVLGAISGEIRVDPFGKMILHGSILQWMRKHSKYVITTDETLSVCVHF